MAKSNAERQREYQARKKLERERAASFTTASEKRSPNEVSKEHESNLAWAQELDATGKRYKSECRKLVDLLAIYEGADILDDESDEEDLGRAKKKAKQSRPEPFKQKITIRKVEFEDDVELLVAGVTGKVKVKIDPNQFEYTTFKGDVVNLKLMYEVNEIVSFRKWLDLRDKLRKDLFFLGRVLGCSLFHNTHQMICDMFVKKDFDGLYFDGYTKDDIHDMIGKQKRFCTYKTWGTDGSPLFEETVATRTMALFAPRSGYKSTIDGLDIVQWMLNCPDIRTMIMTSVEKLAALFMKEVKSYFYLAKRGTPSAFQLLFPEYVLYGRAGTSTSPVWCPAQTVNSKEPHIWITSMDSSSVGSRCDIRKLDDVVEDKNSDNDEKRSILKDKIGATNNLVEPWGFTDIIATRYFTKDWYGYRMSKDENGRNPAPYAYLAISAWKPKPQFKQKYEMLLKTEGGIFDVTEDMVDLWFPYKLSWEELQTKLKENKERGFKNQQLNIATDPKELDQFVNGFTMENMRAHSYARSKAPQGMEIIQTWDIAYSERRTSDFSVGATIGIYKDKHGQLAAVVLDLVYGKWPSSELASQMLAFYEKHKGSIKQVYIEEANGVGFLMGNIKNLAKLRGSEFAHFVRLRQPSTKPNAKTLRFKDLEFLQAHDRLWYVTGAWMDDLYFQFTEYNGKKSTAYRKDDIPDAISFLVEHLPPSALMHNPDPKDVEKEHEQRASAESRQAIYRRMFTTDSPTAPKIVLPVEPEKPVDPRQQAMSQILKILPPAMRKRNRG